MRLFLKMLILFVYMVFPGNKRRQVLTFSWMSRSVSYFFFLAFTLRSTLTSVWTFCTEITSHTGYLWHAATSKAAGSAVLEVTHISATLSVKPGSLSDHLKPKCMGKLPISKRKHVKGEPFLHRLSFNCQWKHPSTRFLASSGHFNSKTKYFSSYL